MPLIPNYFTRFRTQSQSTAASSPSTAPSLDPPTPVIVTPDEDRIVSSLRPKIMLDGDSYLGSAPPLSSRATASAVRRRKSRSLTLNKSTPDTVFESREETLAVNHNTGENGSNFISRMFSSPRKRSVTLPFTGVLSSTSTANIQVSQTPVSSPSGSYHTPPSSAPSPQGSTPSVPLPTPPIVGRKRPYLSRAFQISEETLSDTHPTLPDEESHKQSFNTSHQHDPSSRNAALSGAISQSGKNTNNQGRSRMPQSPLVTATSTQSEIFFTPPRTSTPPPPGRSPNSYRGRQPPNTFPPRSRSRHTFDGGARPTVLGQVHNSPVHFPSFRRMSESLSKIIASPSSPDKLRKEPNVEDDVFTDTQNKSDSPKFVLSGERRLSADWSSIEAIRGNTGGAESWPSSVSKEIVRMSLKGSSSKGAGDTELGSVSTSSPDKSLASDVDINPKNPTLFGSIGEERREFFRAGILGRGRRGHKVRSSLSQLMTVGGSNNGVGSIRDNNKPAVDEGSFGVNVSESKLPSTRKGHDTPTLSATPGGSSIPHVSVTAATPVDPHPPYRLSVMSDPGPGIGASHAAGSKRKIADAEEEPTSSSLTASASAPPLNGNANKNSVRSILLVRSESTDRPSDASQTSHAPSSFRQPQSKRIRLSDTPPPSQTQSRGASPPRSPPRNRNTSSSPTPSRPGSALRTGGAIAPSSFGPRAQSQTSFNSQGGGHHRSPSLSGSGSIPVLAILTPRAPSIDTRHSLNTYHMRDPSLPPSRRQSAVWKGAATIKVLDEDISGMRSHGSFTGWGIERTLFPLQGWAFLVGFLVFPLWWIAAISPVHWGWGTRWRNRRKGYGDPHLIMTEEELQDVENLECDVAHTWRKRCRIMSFFGLFVYVPLIVLIAVLVPRSA